MKFAFALLALIAIAGIARAADPVCTTGRCSLLPSPGYELVKFIKPADPIVHRQTAEPPRLVAASATAPAKERFFARLFNRPKCGR